MRMRGRVVEDMDVRGIESFVPVRRLSMTFFILSAKQNRSLISRILLRHAELTTRHTDGLTNSGKNLLFPADHARCRERVMSDALVGEALQQGFIANG